LKWRSIDMAGVSLAAVCVAVIMADRSTRITTARRNLLAVPIP
jgi:hypothetical protein